MEKYLIDLEQEIRRQISQLEIGRREVAFVGGIVVSFLFTALLMSKGIISF